MPQQGGVSIDFVEPITVATTTVGGPLVPGGCRLAGWSLIETTGAAGAVALLMSGTNVIAAISLPAGGMSAHSMGIPGAHVAGDLTLHMVSGSIQGAVYVTYATD